VAYTLLLLPETPTRASRSTALTVPTGLQFLSYGKNHQYVSKRENYFEIDSSSSVFVSLLISSPLSAMSSIRRDREGRI
jgi:hypothetical protein